MTRRKTLSPFTSCAVALAVLAGGAAFAQPPAAAPAAMALPTPSPELAKLAFFVGDWACTGRAETSPFGPAHATAATVRVHPEYGGFWYAGRYEEKKTAANPHPISFGFFWGYDGTAKALTLDGFDSLGERSHESAPGWQGETIVFTGETAGFGPASPSRDTFTRKDANTLEHLGEMQIEGRWTAIDHETCKRSGR
jgi:hypothetical protein